MHCGPLQEIVYEFGFRIQPGRQGQAVHNCGTGVVVYVASGVVVIVAIGVVVTVVKGVVVIVEDLGKQHVLMSH